MTAPFSVISQWWPEINHGGSIYTKEMSKCYQSGGFCPQKHVVKHLPATHWTLVSFRDKETRETVLCWRGEGGWEEEKVKRGRKAIRRDSEIGGGSGSKGEWGEEEGREREGRKQERGQRKREERGKRKKEGNREKGRIILFI